MNKCPFCAEKYKDKEDLSAHLQEEHEEMIPKNFSAEQLEYFIKTGKTHSNCLMCKNNTPWIIQTGKYARLCGSAKCKEEYAEMFKKRMIGKYGKTTLLNDPSHQKKMLANRSISGVYKWSDGVEFPYTGSYEMDFLKFLDKFMEFPSGDIIAPSPHTYYYEYDGKKHFYIPDFFITSLNLEIEIKDGALNPNGHSKIQAVDKVKEKLKDAVLMSQKEFSYIKVFDKQYMNFLDLLMEMKTTDKPLFYVKDRNAISENASKIKMAIESAIHSDEGKLNLIQDSFYSLSTKDISLMEANLLQLDNMDNSKIQNELTITMENHIHFNSSSKLLLGNIKHYDGSLPEGSLDIAHKKLFDIYHPGFVDSEINNFVLRFIDTDDKTTFYNSILEKAINVTNKESFVRDIKVAQYVISEQAKRNVDNRNELIESYCWLENIVCESTVTIGKEKRIPVYTLLSHTGTMLSNAIKSYTGDEYSHASISLDPTLNNMYSFGRKYKSNPLIGKFVKEDIKDGLFNDVKDQASYALYVTFVTEEEYKLIKDRLEYFKKNMGEFNYNFAGLFSHAMGRESGRTHALFCSQFVDMVLSSAKPHFDKHSSLVKPTDYMDHEDFHFVSKGLLRDYNIDQTIKKVELISSRIKLDKTSSYANRLAYFPLSQGEIKTGFVNYQVNEVVFVPTTYSELKRSIKESGVHIDYYTVVPLSTLSQILVSVEKEVAYIQGPFRIKYTNKNLI